MFLHKKGTFSYINVRDTSSLDYKNKHAEENAAPPYKFVVLYRVSHIEFHGLTAGSMFQGYHYLVPGINSFY